LGDLEDGLQAAVACMRPGARLAVISFHSLEDRIVKRFINAHAKRLRPTGGCRRWRLRGDLRPMRPAQRADEAETAANPRARSRGAAGGRDDWSGGMTRTCCCS
jgi:16S rRNA (cytosine1402-N4)-methyltransferase